MSTSLRGLGWTWDDPSSWWGDDDPEPVDPGAVPEAIAAIPGAYLSPTKRCVAGFWLDSYCDGSDCYVFCRPQPPRNALVYGNPSECPQGHEAETVAAGCPTCGYYCRDVISGGYYTGGARPDFSKPAGSVSTWLFLGVVGAFAGFALLGSANSDSSRSRKR